MFGAEMGANERGVVIGNEALFTKEKPADTGLTGMDLLRLALERSRTAAEARDIIIKLLEQYGQGGNCGYRQKMKYMNGFIIADPAEAYVLETVKSWWAWKRIKTIWSISNIISLTNDFDQCSPGLIENAARKGWRRSKAEFNFRECYSDRIYTWGAMGKDRESCTRAYLAQRQGGLTSRNLMAALRDHGPGHDWRPDRPKGGTVCMHAANKLLRPSQSVGSLVANLSAEKNYFYTTAAANPCMTPFFPVFAPDTRMPSDYREGGAEYDPGSFWWRGERLHRQALPRFSEALRALQPRVEKLEDEMVAAIENGKAPGQEMIDEFFKKAAALIEDWGAKLDDIEPGRLGWLFQRFWRKYNQRNRVPESGV